MNKVSKYGCKQCYWDSKKLTLDDFIKRATKIHKSKYDYSHIKELDTVETKVEIMCPDHGIFVTTAAIHLGGFNCPHCQREDALGGYNSVFFERNPEQKNTDAVLYLVAFDDGDNTQFIKIGITKNLRTRFAGYRNYKKVVLFEKTMTLYDAFLEEQKILKTIKRKFIPTDEKFSGRYECFHKDEQDDLLSYLRSLP